MKNQISDEDLAISNSTERIVVALKPKKNLILFLDSEFFVTLCDYIIQKFPINAEIFANAQVANISTIDKECFSKIKFLFRSTMFE